MLGWDAVLLYTAAAMVCLVGIYIYKSYADSPALPDTPEVPDMPDGDIKADLLDLRKALDRLHEAFARHDDNTEDAFKDVNRRVDRIERGVERIDTRMEAEARIGSALARLGGKRDE